MKNISYGISNFERIKTENYYFIDKTNYIEILESYGSPYLFFLRPRRFGKSMLVSMLGYYYDIAQKEQFETLFGDTYIGKNPTARKNSYPILHFNFSMIQTFGSLKDIQNSFVNYIYTEIESFIEKYQLIFNLSNEAITELKQIENKLDIVRSLFLKLRNIKIPAFLIIDEYDSFANNILAEQGSSAYELITHSGGFLRNFFTIIKGLTDNKEIDRLFITGVSPLVMADVTSGFNIGDNISQDLQLSSMVGVSHSEALQMLNYYQSFGVFTKSNDFIINDFNTWYNGYAFNPKIEKVYNTTSILYFINQNIKNKEMPISLIDENLRTDYGKFRFLLTENNRHNGNFSVLREIVDKNQVTANFIRSFALNEIIEKQRFVSLLFYLGFLSFKDSSPLGTYTYTIPNKLVSTLLWEFIQKSLNDVYTLRIDNYFLSNAFKDMATLGTWQPAFEYIMNKFYQAVSVRDFVFHEEGVKMFILSWLNMAVYYKVYSEREIEKGFADIFIEPERRYGNEIKFGYIIELKYIKAELLKSKTKTQLAINEAIETAKLQLENYSDFEEYQTIKIILVASAKKLLHLSCL